MNRQDDELSAWIREHATRHAAPARLRAKISTEVALLEARRPGRSAPGKCAGLTGSTRWQAWRGPAIGFLSGALLAGTLVPVASNVWVGRSSEAAIVVDYIEALQRGQRVAVASSDRHTVKPCFQGRLDYSPPVRDPSAQGLPPARCAGGAAARRCDCRHRLRTRSPPHRLSVWPLAPGRTGVQRHGQHRGFNTLAWTAEGMQLWAVSDVEAGELERFRAAWSDTAMRP